MKLIINILHCWKSIIITGGILFLSFTSPSTFNGVPTFENEDKLIHMIMHIGLTGALMLDFRQFAKHHKTTLLAFILICLAFPAFLGGAVEILQPLYFAPRTGEWSDWFSDITGVLIGLSGMRLIMPKSVKEYFK